MRTRDMRRPGRTLAAASTAVALAIGLAACGSDDEGGSTNNAGGLVGSAHSHLFSARGLHEFAEPVMIAVANDAAAARHYPEHMTAI